MTAPVVVIPKPLDRWKAKRYTVKEIHMPSLQHPERWPVVIIMQEPKPCPMNT